MDTSTYAGRIATAHQLRAALHRAPGDIRPDADTGGPIGNCGRDPEAECGMKNPEECSVHCSPPDNDPELLSYAGTLSQRREQLRAARRQGLQR
jgi:hypothetical protein